MIPDTTIGATSKAPPELAGENTFIFNSTNLGYWEQGLRQAVDVIRTTIASVDQPSTGILPHELAASFRGVDLNHSLPGLADALTEVKRLYLKDAVYFHHPRYMAHLNCPVVVPAIVAEVVAASVNTAVETWDQSAGGTFIEQKLIDWTVAKIGLGAQADGVFTSGGSQSNLMAMLLARDHFCAQRQGHENKRKGLPYDFGKLRIFTSEKSHFSVQKAAAILGLGYDAVVSVPCDRYFRMDIAALRREIDHCRAQGLYPMAVVATAGTTDFGSIDPLFKVAELCRCHGIWMHVDAAYGGGLLVSPRHRHFLAGIEQADSVTVDYHKSFFQPVSCSAFLVRHKHHLATVTHHADYLNPLSQQQEDTPNLVDKSIQTTRRFDALKLWLTLRTMGPEAIGTALDQVIDLARKTYLLLLSEPTIDVIHQPQLSTLVFRYVPGGGWPADEIDHANAHIREALARSGAALIAGTKVAGRQYLKFTLLNPVTTIADVQAVLTMIKRQGEAYFANQETSREQEPPRSDHRTNQPDLYRELENA